MRYVCAILALVFIVLQSHLWLSDQGHRETREIRETVREVSSENDGLRRRNAALAAEVRNLKTSVEAAEERARTDLGMIGSSETFYQVVPSPQTIN